MVLEIFSRKACNFLCGSGFAPVWLNLWIFKTVVVIKSFPHWSQRPCFKAFFSCVSLTCYTSGKLVLINIFHVFHNFCVSKHVTFVAPLWQNLCIFRIVNLIKYFSHLIQSCVSCTSKHVTPGKLVSEIFSRKTRNFFVEVAHCVHLQHSVVIKYFPHLSQNQSQSFFLMCWFNTLHIWKVGFGNNFSQNSQIFSTLFTMLTFVRLFSSTHWPTHTLTHPRGRCLEMLWHLKIENTW